MRKPYTVECLRCGTTFPATGAEVDYLDNTPCPGCERIGPYEVEG